MLSRELSCIFLAYMAVRQETQEPPASIQSNPKFSAFLTDPRRAQKRHTWPNLQTIHWELFFIVSLLFSLCYVDEPFQKISFQSIFINFIWNTYYKESMTFYFEQRHRGEQRIMKLFNLDELPVFLRCVWVRHLVQFEWWSFSPNFEGWIYLGRLNIF